MADTIDDLRLLIRSRHPLITIETEEERRALDRVLQVVRSLAMHAYVWNVVEGLRNTPPASREIIGGTLKPADALS